MPTGYTASVADGTVTDLKTFALTLARGVGALVMMRDEPWDAPIPDRFEPSDYYVKRIEELTAEYARLEALTPGQVKAEILREQNDYADRKAEAFRRHEEQKARYDAMIAKVEAWQGAPEGIKEFALEQLRDSKDFDCREPFRYYGSPPQSNPFNWINDKLATTARDLKRAEDSYAEEIERTEARNAWIKQLKESLND